MYDMPRPTSRHYALPDTLDHRDEQHFQFHSLIDDLTDQGQIRAANDEGLLLTNVTDTTTDFKSWLHHQADI